MSIAERRYDCTPDFIIHAQTTRPPHYCSQSAGITHLGWASPGCKMATCDICGKVIKSTSAEAMAAHQRESSSCYPLTASASAPKAVRDAEEQLRAAIDESKRLAAGGGSFEEQERAVRERSSAVLALKRARQESRDAKKEIRDIAQASMSAQGWTDALRAGEEARFARAEGDAVESRLASETIGLVSASAFKQKRAEIEAEREAQREREEQQVQEAALAQQQRKRAKKQQREREQRRGLSFDEDV